MSLSAYRISNRRRWSDEERRQILEDAFAPGACVAQVARHHDVSTALIYTWRRKLLDAGVEREAELPEALPTPVFAEAVIDEDVMAAGAAEHPAMIIDLPRGKRLSIFAAAPPALVAAALKGLR